MDKKTPMLDPKKKNEQDIEGQDTIQARPTLNLMPQKNLPKKIRKPFPNLMILQVMVKRAQRKNRLIKRNNSLKV